MAYTFNKITGLTFNEAVKQVTQELKNEGFGIVTELDMKEKFKEKLNLDFRNYKILGACDPALAYKALQIEPNIGAMLPCNVLVQEHENGEVEIAAVNPVHSIGGVGNIKLAGIAQEVGTKIQKIIDRI